MNNLDKDYISLVNDILKNGHSKGDRTGTGTKSVFGRQIRHKMSDGFPLLTTKKMPWKVMVTELMWFLRGDTNIKYLVDNGCNIWNGDAYKNYINNPDYKAKSVAHLFGSQAGQLVECPTQEDFINKIKTDDEFAEKWGELGPIYGKQWRSWSIMNNFDPLTGEVFIGNISYDQIQNVLNELRTNPDSRRLIVSAWNVGEMDKMVLPPCHNFFQFYTRELTHNERFEIYKKVCGRDLQPNISGVNFKQFHFNEYNIPTRAISLMWNQRSVDTGLGLPFNIASYALLLQLIGQVVNMVPEELIGNLGDTHLYNNHIEPIQEQLGREGFGLPKVLINSEFWPTENGECGVGPLHPSFSFLIENIQIDDFQLIDYESHPKINLPLSN
jgi:thymidylate synthase